MAVLMSALNVSASGMTAQRLRLDLISQNIANVNTTRDENGNVYRRQVAVFQEKKVGVGAFSSTPTAGTFSSMPSTDSYRSFSSLLNDRSLSYGKGVMVTGIAEDHVSAMNKVYDPAHPDADEDGFQIRVLLLTLFYRLLPTLIEEGKIYIAESPLYELTIEKGKRTVVPGKARLWRALKPIRRYLLAIYRRIAL